MCRDDESAAALLGGSLSGASRTATALGDKVLCRSQAHSSFSLNRCLRIVQVEFSEHEAARYAE